jgi:hypothetical protein
MGQQAELYKKWKKARAQLDLAFRDSAATLVIHYSCESFYERIDPRSPRITSIAVRNLESGQTVSFSIHLMAEQKNRLSEIDQHFDELEKEMLERFYEHAKVNQHRIWLHWNMRDANYGFPAIENRMKALGGTPFHIPEERLVDLSRVLIGLYGVSYTAHPRLQTLMEKNHIRALDFLKGQDEARAFEQGMYLELHQSTLRKVDVLANIAERTHSGQLVTAATWWQTKGRSTRVALEWIKDHWLLGLLAAIVVAVVKTLL